MNLNLYNSNVGALLHNSCLLWYQPLCVWQICFLLPHLLVFEWWYLAYRVFFEQFQPKLTLQWKMYLYHFLLACSTLMLYFFLSFQKPQLLLVLTWNLFDSKLKDKFMTSNVLLVIPLTDYKGFDDFTNWYIRATSLEWKIQAYNKKKYEFLTIPVKISYYMKINSRKNKYFSWKLSTKLSWVWFHVNFEWVKITSWFSKVRKILSSCFTMEYLNNLEHSYFGAVVQTTKLS